MRKEQDIYLKVTVDPDELRDFYGRDEPLTNIDWAYHLRMGDLRFVEQATPVENCPDLRERFFSALEAAGWSDGEEIPSDEINAAFEKANSTGKGDELLRKLNQANAQIAAFRARLNALQDLGGGLPEKLLSEEAVREGSKALAPDGHSWSNRRPALEDDARECIRAALDSALSHSEDGSSLCKGQGQWFRFNGPTPQTTQVVLSPGRLYEFKPGEIFNEHGTRIGYLNREDAPKLESEDGSKGRVVVELSREEAHAARQNLWHYGDDADSALAGAYGSLAAALIRHPDYDEVAQNRAAEDGP
jgi:hypothetical protein